MVLVKLQAEVTAMDQAMVTAMVTAKLQTVVTAQLQAVVTVKVAARVKNVVGSLLPPLHPAQLVVRLLPSRSRDVWGVEAAVC